MQDPDVYLLPSWLGEFHKVVAINWYNNCLTLMYSCHGGQSCTVSNKTSAKILFSTGSNVVKFETKRCTTNSTETKKKVTRTKYMYLRFSDKSRYKDVYLINTSLVDRIYIFFFYLKYHFCIIYQSNNIYVN